MMRNILFIAAVFLLFSCNNNSQQNNVDENNTDSSKSVTKTLDTLATVEAEADKTKETPKEEIEYNWGNNSIRVYINDPDPGATNVRVSPGGDVLYKLSKDYGYEVNISGVKNGWFLVRDIDNIDDESMSYNDIKGYIHGSVLSAGTTNYGGEEINLYSEPDKNSEVVETLHSEKELKLIDGNEDSGWLFVRVMNYDTNDFSVKGWIQTKWLCGSLRTNCS